jgi:DNA-binding transcriptional LysR family regulator
MEKQFKVLIVDRSQKQFRLTPEGEEIFAAYIKILTTYENLENDLMSMQNVLSGEIHVSTVYSIGLHELPPYIKHFLVQYPEINLKVEYRRSNLVYQDIEQSAVDLGLVAYKSNAENLEFIPFKEDNLVFVCSPKHPFSKNRNIQINDFEGANFVAYEKDIPTRKASDEIFEKNNISVNNVKEYDNTETVKNAVEINTGIALIPETSVKQELKQRNLIKLYLPDLDLKRPLYIVHKKGKILSPARQKFIELLTSKFED